LAVAFCVGMVALMVVGSVFWSPRSAPPQAQATPTWSPSMLAVDYHAVLLRVTCADGWSSPSIGRRGACSHHGGVVTLWRGSDGVTRACGGQYRREICTPWR
jgi:hypothetical protein